jgi:hypothetical protein
MTTKSMNKLLELEKKESLNNSKTGLDMKENGYLENRFVKVTVYKSGLMVLCTKDIGKTTKPTVKVV